MQVHVLMKYGKASCFDLESILSVFKKRRLETSSVRDLLQSSVDNDMPNITDTSDEEETTTWFWNESSNETDSEEEEEEEGNI